MKTPNLQILPQWQCQVNFPTHAKRHNGIIRGNFSMDAFPDWILFMKYMGRH